MNLKIPGKSFAREVTDYERHQPSIFKAIVLYNSSLEYLGDGGAQPDYSRAFTLNAEAAELRFPDAILAMGWFYLNGYGVKRDVKTAQHWYRRSARDGEPRAMYSLGETAYVSGGYDDARRWFERASNHGHVRSLYWLGKLAWRGHGVSRDHSAAFAFFHRAAQSRDPESLRVLRYLSRASASLNGKGSGRLSERRLPARRGKRLERDLQSGTPESSKPPPLDFLQMG